MSQQTGEHTSQTAHGEGSFYPGVYMTLAVDLNARILWNLGKNVSLHTFEILFYNHLLKKSFQQKKFLIDHLVSLS